MIIRQVSLNDAEKLVALFHLLDTETAFMLFEPGERQLTAEQQRKQLSEFVDSNQQTMFVAENDAGEIAGFIVGVGGKMNRIRHSLYCVIGLRNSAQGKGIGRQLMTTLEAWASHHDFHRLELTVMAHNARARQLYTSAGFSEEGIKRDAMRVDGKYVDEIYMAKLLNANSAK
ncbi:GNAT family N-acetyltransferase [Photobacterium sp. TLY01]|uniref:GNAT family N-acetyltransferase n=1 Tax=Photobacterium sp. TLY01 TaxID=2907534 RepID=UPI001F443EEA|nr:GNAT family protein [Photobacterium sp. TLY01]UIP29096.1 GNAT family N-acetyltransferase [Photobacterium sp. TLY01]